MGISINIPLNIKIAFIVINITQLLDRAKGFESSTSTLARLQSAFEIKIRFKFSVKTPHSLALIVP